MLRRWPGVFALLCLVLVTATVSWIGQHRDPVSNPWAKTQAYWEEPDLRRLIETYRYRHGSYPRDLTDLARDHLPIDKQIAQRWKYQRTNQSYTLKLR
jgi:hypothetical protein